MHSPHIELLNRRLAENLGFVNGNLGRFAWCWAPDHPFFVYDRDNRTLIKKSWADAPAPWSGTLGKVWLLGEYRNSRAFDHMGFAPSCGKCNGIGQCDLFGNGRIFTCDSCNGVGRIEGVRVPRTMEHDYFPYFETVVMPLGSMPSEALNANYIWAIREQMELSTEQDENAFEIRMADEKYTEVRNARRDAEAWREQAAAGYDEWTGAFGNCEPGRRDGFLSLPSTSSEVLPGFGFDNI